MIDPHLVQTYLKQNPWMVGGASLMGVGGIITSLTLTLRQIPTRIGIFLNRRFTTSVTVTNSDKLFSYTKEWFSKNEKKIKKTNILDVTCDQNKLIFSPGFGMHHLWYKCRLVQIWRLKEDKKSASYDENGNHTRSNYLESFNFKFYTTNKNIINDFFQSIFALQQKEIKIPSLLVPQRDYWLNLMALTHKSYESVILNKSQKDLIINDISHFYKNQKWYNDLSIPYRRGYLLHGLPGTGKSSLIQMIGKYFCKDVYFVSLSNPKLDDESLITLCLNVGMNSILVFEDIDAIFSGREQVNKTLLPGVTFSGLLNVLDGMVAGHGRIVFLTTNHKEKLDPALIRPGRIDFQMEFTYATKEQIVTLFERFYGGNLAEKFYEFLSVPVTMAMLQSHFLKFKDNPVAAIENIYELTSSDLKVPNFN